MPCDAASGLQRGARRAVADQQQRHAGHLADGPDQPVEALGRLQPAEAADDHRVRRDAEPLPGGAAQRRVVAELGRVDAVRDHADPLGRHAPGPQPAGHRLGHRDRGLAEPLAGQVEGADRPATPGGPRSRRRPGSARWRPRAGPGPAGRPPGRARRPGTGGCAPRRSGRPASACAGRRPPRRRGCCACVSSCTRVPSARIAAATDPGLDSVTTSQSCGSRRSSSRSWCSAPPAASPVITCRTRIRRPCRWSAGAGRPWRTAAARCPGRR